MRTPELGLDELLPVHVSRDGTWEMRAVPRATYLAELDDRGTGSAASAESFLVLRAPSHHVTIVGGGYLDELELADGEIGLVEARMLTCRR